MGKVPLAHEVVSLDDLVDVLSPDSNSDTHDHVLRTLSDLAVDSEQVRSLEGLETKLDSRESTRSRSEGLLTLGQAFQGFDDEKLT